ncbi:Glycoprotein 3-alpha-L-fucosyltransferase A [Porphyridium purpureum]|uniref:Fucosyltransferase n=1 Tax=Porphyridium purpureum TaxID=35688 RepID=A0A5J4Z6H8_PORPP|nr:Glycoprotein 3-alpha-L-fucosyltransferase A [Porphyridium purpureum]|eukprot:POR9423..scf295_1
MLVGVLTLVFVFLRVDIGRSSGPNDEMQHDVRSFRVYQQSRKGKADEVQPNDAHQHHPWYMASSRVRGGDFRLENSDHLVERNGSRVPQSYRSAHGWTSSCWPRDRPGTSGLDDGRNREEYGSADIVLPRIPQLLDAERFGVGKQVAGVYNTSRSAYDPCSVPCRVQASSEEQPHALVQVMETLSTISGSSGGGGLSQQQQLLRRIARGRPQDLPALASKRCGRLPKAVLWLESAQIEMTEELLELYDVIIGPRADSDLQVIAVNEEHYNVLSEPSDEARAGTAAVFLSHCTPERAAVIHELWRAGLSVDSFGKCLPNAAVPPGVQTLAWQEQKRAVLRKYTFTVVVEAARGVRDMVSEQMYDAIVAGSVPVVFGAPNVREFAPADESYIDAARFPSARALANYLRGLLLDPIRLEMFTRRWKARGVSRNFQALLRRTSSTHIACRLCHHLSQHL